MNVHFYISTFQNHHPGTGNFQRWYTVRSLIMYNLWPLPGLKLVPCWPLCTSSNCELIKSKQSSGSLPVASGQTDFVQSSTKQCVSFCDIFLVFLGILGSSIAEKLFETSHYPWLPNNKKKEKRSIVEINWANFRQQKYHRVAYFFEKHLVFDLASFEYTQNVFFCLFT